MVRRAGDAELGRQIAAARVGKGLTQSQLAEMAGVGRTTVTDLERGRAKPLMATMRLIEGALGGGETGGGGGGGMGGRGMGDFCPSMPAPIIHLSPQRSDDTTDQPDDWAWL